MMKFADDTKLGNRAANYEDCRSLQQCIDKLIIWANTWSMEFNVKKCKVMHLGRRNPIHGYNMNGTPLQVCNGERDIGVHVSDTLKPGTQCAEAARRANAILTQISRAFMYRDRRVFVQLYKQFVRCHLEFAAPAWSPWQEGDIQLLERVQIRAVKMIHGLQSNTYEEKLAELGLRTLEDRRKRLDLVQTFKIINGHDNVKRETWFKLVGQNERHMTRASSYHKNIVGTRSNTEIRKQFFSNRVVPLWNALSEHVKESTTVQIFKRRLEETVI